MLNHNYRALLIIALALPLAGCWKEQQQAFAKCAAAHPFNSEQPARSDTETPMARCMSDAGYAMDYDSRYCGGSALPRRSPYCYSPKGFFAIIGYNLEMLREPGPKPPGTPL